MPSLDLMTLLIVCPMVFLGGLVDAIAGGGGLITLPAYLIAGLPPHLAIGTNKLASAMGMCVSTARLYRGGFIDLRLAAVPVLTSLVGSALGAQIALLVPPSLFQVILILCMPFAAIVVMRKKTLEHDPVDMPLKRRWILLGFCAFFCGLYDGFYGPGAGTFMLLSFVVVARLGVRDASGQMKMANLTSGLAAFATFAAAGEVSWALGCTAGLFGIAGHYIGAGLVMKNGSRIVRPIIAVVITILFVKTAFDYF